MYDYRMVILHMSHKWAYMSQLSRVAANKQDLHTHIHPFLSRRESDGKSRSQKAPNDAEYRNLR